MKMNQMARFGIVLGVICLTATLVLAVTYHITKPKIDEQMRLEERKALEAILPEADTFTEKSVDGIGYFEALKGDRLVGYCVRVTANGYGSFIRMVVGVKPDGVIEGVEIIENQETPGLGAKIDEQKPGEKRSRFLRQFEGKPAQSVEVKKNIDAITGATISSKAVTDAVREKVTEFLSKVKR